MPPKRSSSRGRRVASKSPARSKSASRAKSAKSPKTPKSPPTPAAPAPANDMDYSENDAVMARWPGTTLYYKAKVTFVRPEDNEYDVQFEDGTVYTLKAKDVRSQTNFTSTKTRGRSSSRSRGRSPGRRKSPARKAKEPSTPSSKPSAPKAADKTPTPATRRSSRLEAKAAEALSSDDEDGKTSRGGRGKRSSAKLGAMFADMSFEWVSALFFIALGPLIVVSLHKLCSGGSCKLAMPVLSRNWRDYWDRDSFLAVVCYAVALRILSFLPIGAQVPSNSGPVVRMNGFYTVLLLLAAMPALIYRKVSLKFVTEKYFHLMTSSLLFGALLSLIALIASRWGKRSNINQKGNTGNLIVDFFNGRELNPFFARVDLKLVTFRFAMIGLAVINAVLVWNDYVASGKLNPAVALSGGFQLIYALDALFFEAYYFNSHDALNTGFGFSLVTCYHSFPFLSTLVTRYLIAKKPVMPWYCLASIALVNALGYVIFRKSESQRCEFANRPSSMANVETITGAGGKKILVSGWWGVVRHPNFLGEILLQWSWVLPALTKVDLLVYYLPVVTTMMLLLRCSQQNKKNKRRYGSAWDTYCNRVPANLIPKVY